MAVCLILIKTSCGPGVGIGASLNPKPGSALSLESTFIEHIMKSPLIVCQLVQMHQSHGRFVRAYAEQKFVLECGLGSAAPRDTKSQSHKYPLSIKHLPFGWRVWRHPT